MNNVNVPLLRKAVEWVEAEAAKPPEVRDWYQAAWVNNWNSVDAATGVHTCGTTYCVAGYVGQLVDPVYADDAWGHQWEPDVDERVHVSKVAQAALGLNDDQARALFNASNTATQVRTLAESFVGGAL